MIDRPRIEKIDAVVEQLEASIYLTLKDFSPIPIHSLVWASRSILYDLHKVDPNPILSRIESSIENLVKPEFKSDWYRYAARTANFLKHADKDPNDILEGVDVAGVNAIELPICIFAVSHLIDKLPPKLEIGFFYFGFLSDKWINFEAICKDRNFREYEYYKSMTDTKRKHLLLDAFEAIHCY